MFPLELAVIILIGIAAVLLGFCIGFVLGKDRRFLLAFNLGWDAGVKFALQHPDVAQKARL